MRHSYRIARLLMIGALALVISTAGFLCPDDESDEFDLQRLQLLLVNERGDEGITVDLKLGRSLTAAYFEEPEIALRANPLGQRDGFNYHAELILEGEVAGRVAAGDKLRIIATHQGTQGVAEVCTLSEDADEGDVWAIVDGTNVLCYFHTVECEHHSC